MPQEEKKPIFVVESPNEKHPEMSAKVSLESDVKVGRYITAKEDIRPFETVLSEEPFASVLYPEKAGMNCSHCLTRLKAAIGCKLCASVVYCSVYCRDQAQESYHQWECQFQDVITGLGCSSVARLALRMVSSKPLSFFLQRKDQILAAAVMGERGKDKDDEQDTYLQILTLVGLQDLRWPEDFLARSAMALILLGILRAAGYFGKAKASGNSESYTPNELFVGSLILKHLQILQFNAHEIHEVLRGSQKSLKPSKNVPIALAIYPTASFINHSCHGSLARCFQGTRMVLKALGPISKSHEVSDNYGPTFYLKSRSERRKDLSSRYWFECQCPACLQNWPLLSKLHKSSDDYSENIKIDDLMSKGKTKEAVDLLVHLLESNKRAEKAPSEDYIRAEDKLRTCINSYGNIVMASNSK